MKITNNSDHKVKLFISEGVVTVNYELYPRQTIELPNGDYSINAEVVGENFTADLTIEEDG